MTSLTPVLMLAISFIPDPLPDIKALDPVTFAVDAYPFGTTGHLAITATGNVTDRNQPGQLTTGSGGAVTTAGWEVPKAEAVRGNVRGVLDRRGGLREVPPPEPGAEATGPGRLSIPPPPGRTTMPPGRRPVLNPVPRTPSTRSPPETRRGPPA